nr:FmdB family zinc ribbon protein [Ardenticatena sp.]
MPIYEYRCQACGRKVTVLHRSIHNIQQPNCPRCGSDQLKRLISKVSVVRSEESRLESLADPDRWGDFDENDPRSMARFMRKMKEELGSELGDELGDEFDEVVERLEAGEDPESIEESLGDTFGGDGGDGIDMVM